MGAELSSRRASVSFRLLLITDGRGEPDRTVRIVRQAVEGGLRAVMLREKKMSDEDLLPLAVRLKELVQGRGGLLIVNRAVDLARRVGAHGVHLGHDAMPLEEARGRLGGDVLIGVSTHAESEARAAASGGADYITFGPVYRPRSKPSWLSPVGTEAVRRVAGAVSIPVLALGGIGRDNLARVLRAGAHGAAFIGEVFEAPDPREAACELCRIASGALSDVSERPGEG